MIELLKQFEAKRPEIVFSWKDNETEAEGWVVINSLRGGAAGGGTRMRKGLDQHEVESLAKTMEVKFTVSGPAIGGAKSGINFDPADPRKAGVLDRWYRAVTPLLKYYYGTGGDLNIDEIHEVIPLTERYGLWHPQEGVLVGHHRVREHERIHQIGQLRQGVSKVVEDPSFTPDLKKRYRIADLVTGYGVAESIRHYYAAYPGGSNGKRAIIQGWGNVAGAAAYYLAQQGVRIVGIIDREGGLINPDGFSIQEITDLFVNRSDNRLPSEGLLPFHEVDSRIWHQKAEIFIPAAASRLVTRQHVEQLITGGLEVISAGANVPFADREIFFGPTMAFADKHVSVITDFIANCGMARVFAYLMQPNTEISDLAIFSDVSNVIGNAIRAIRGISNERTQMASRAYEIALSELLIHG